MLYNEINGEGENGGIRNLQHLRACSYEFISTQLLSKYKIYKYYKDNKDMEEE